MTVAGIRRMKGASWKWGDMIFAKSTVNASLSVCVGWCWSLWVSDCSVVRVRVVALGQPPACSFICFCFASTIFAPLSGKTSKWWPLPPIDTQFLCLFLFWSSKPLRVRLYNSERSLVLSCFVRSTVHTTYRLFFCVACCFVQRLFSVHARALYTLNLNQWPYLLDIDTTKCLCLPGCSSPFSLSRPFTTSATQPCLLYRYLPTYTSYKSIWHHTETIQIQAPPAQQWQQQPWPSRTASASPTPAPAHSEEKKAPSFLVFLSSN